MKPNMKRVNETRYGVYVWQMPNGAVVADEERNFLSISSEFGDPRRIAELRAAVRACGIEVGQPLFMPGHRKIDDEEYERQSQRLAEGLIPDEYDAAAWREEFKNRER